MCSIGYSIKECLDQIDSNIYTQEEIHSITEGLIQLLMESDTRKVTNEQEKNESDLEEDELDQINQNVTYEEEFHVSIAEIIG